jgi:fucose permease
MSAAVEARAETTEATSARFAVRRAIISGMMAMGLFISIVGPVLPGVRATFGLTLGEAGLLALANSVGYVISGFVGGLLADRWDRRLILLIGAAAMAGGAIAFMLAPSWPLLLLGTAIIGVGVGTVDAPGNALINEHSGRWRGADLNLAHGFFGVGAIVGPLLAGWLLAAGLNWRWLAAPAFVATLALIGLTWGLRLPSRRADAGPARIDWSVLRQPLLILLGVVLCLYVGVEMMVGAWAFSHLQTAFDAGDGVAGVATALYWGGLTVGRFVMGTVGARIGPHALIVGNAVGAALALGLLVAAPTLPLAIAGLALVGLALANVFPEVLAIAGAAFPNAGGAATGALVAAGGLGGSLFPWLSGIVAERYGLGAALAGGVALLAALLVVEGLVIRQQRAMSNEQ